MARFLNPYNFVRPLAKTQQIKQLEDKFKNAPESLTADEAKQLLLWRCPPPPHDRFTGLSGKITCKMTAVTPVFVSDSEGVREDANGHRTFRFFQVDGQDIIPASSVRGAIRSVFESVTNSSWAVFNDQTMSYREAASHANKLLPAIVLYNPENDKWGVELLHGHGVYKFAKIPLNLLEESGFNHGQIATATLKSTNTGFVVSKLSQDEPSSNKEVMGVICATGRNIEKKRSDRLFFDTGEDIDRFILNDEIIDRYNNLIRLTREYHTDTIKDVQSGRTSTKDAALSRYHYADKKDEIKEFIHKNNPLIEKENYMFPVYVRLDDAGKRVRYLAPVSIPRVLETRSFYQIMRESGYDYLLPATNYHELSSADRVFGWVSQDANEDDFGDRVAYKGRIRLSHAQPKAGNVERLADMRLTILSAPKPTTTRFYVKPSRDLNRGVNAPKQTNTRWQNFTDEQLRYSKPENMLRGRKIYRHHKQFNRNEASSSAQSNQNRTIVGTHAEGTEYTFKIHFENLQSVELGALLWTLQLNDGWQGYHRIGYGKPLGFGSTTIELEKTEFHNSQRYIGSTDPVTVDTNACIQEFKDAMLALYGKPFEQLENVQDLKALLSEPPLEVIHYPRTAPNKDNAGDKNYEWFVNNKRENKKSDQRGPNIVLPYAVEDLEGLPYIQRNKDKTIKVDW
jgi:CRISPR-associated protein (TIGR03986 family)